MPTLDTLHVFVTTSSTKDADTDSSVSLVYTERGGQEHALELSDLPHDERERGRTDHYVFRVGSREDLAQISERQFRLVARGGDAWLPGSVFVLGAGGDAFEVFVALRSWPAQAWLSTDLSDADGRAEKARRLDARATPVSP